MNHSRKLIGILSVIVLLLLVQVPITSCGGAGAKAAKALQKVVKSKAVKSAGKTIGKSGDDIVRHISKTSVTCTTCGGHGQVDFVDDDYNYLYTDACPDCEGKGTVTKFEFK